MIGLFLCLLVGVVLLPLIFFKVVLGLVLLPFKLVGALFKGLAGLLAGLAGLGVGLAVAVLAVVAIPLLILAIPLLPFVFMGGVVWLLVKASRPVVVRVP